MTDAITRIRKIKEAGYTGPAVTTLLEICDRQAAEIERLRAESDERLKNTVAQAMEIERLRKGLSEVEFLIKESAGVYGLHLNGELSPWGSLRTGGEYEAWLVNFDNALEETP